MTVYTTDSSITCARCVNYYAANMFKCRTCSLTAFRSEVVYLVHAGGIADNRDPKSVIVGFNAGYSEWGTVCPDTRLGQVPRSSPPLGVYVHKTRTRACEFTHALDVRDGNHRCAPGSTLTCSCTGPLVNFWSAPAASSLALVLSLHLPYLLPPS